MPMYDFKCRCGKLVEKFRLIVNRNDTVVCPDCRAIMGRQFPRIAVRRDYSELKYMMDPVHGEKFSDLNAKKCGVPV